MQTELDQEGHGTAEQQPWAVAPYAMLDAEIIQLEQEHDRTLHAVEQCERRLMHVEAQVLYNCPRGVVCMSID